MGKRGKHQKTSPAAAPAEVIVKWKLDKRGKLTVSCNGRMPDYYGGNNSLPPWHEVRDEIKTVCLKEGVTEVGGKAFEGYRNLRKVIIPWSLKRLHHDCFKNCTSLKQIVTEKETEYRFSGEGFSLKSANQKAAVEMQMQKTQEIVFGINSFYAVPWAMKKWGDFYVKKDILYTSFADLPELQIPEGVRVIHTFAFMDTNVNKLKLPRSLVRLESFALANTKIEKLMIPGNVEYIGDYAFADSELKILLFDDSKGTFDGRLEFAGNAFKRTVFPTSAVKRKHLPEAYKVDVSSGGKEYDFYKKLCIKEKYLDLPVESEDKVVYGTVSLAAENSIYRRLQRGSAIFRIRYDQTQKKVLSVSSWHYSALFSYMYAEYVTEPYYETEGQLELKSTGHWYFEKKNILIRSFSIRSVLEEWDKNGQIRRLNENECEEWFWAPGYYGDWRVPEKDLLERWMKLHPEYTV